MTGPPENRSRYGVENVGSFRIGGVGVVYEAILLEDHHGLPAGTPVGLKALTGVDHDRFSKLARRSAVLRDHPHPRLANHIESFVGPPVSLAVVEEEDSNLFFTAHRWVDGTSLQDHLATASPTDILDWIGDVAEAVDHLHSLPGGGIAHRDIHARNIIIGPDAHACLIDFDTLLWGEGADTVLTSLASGPVVVPPVVLPSITSRRHRQRRARRAPELAPRGHRTPDGAQGGCVETGGTEASGASYEARASQAQDRAMLALVLLKAFGRVSEPADLQEVSARCLVELSNAAAGPRVVETLQNYLREPPATATALVDTIRGLITASGRNPRARATLRLRPRTAHPLRRAWPSASTRVSVPRVLTNRKVVAVVAAVAATAYIGYQLVDQQSPNSPTTSSPTHATPSGERTPVLASAIAAGTSASCLTRKPDGSVWCWGRVPLMYESSDEVTLWHTPTPRRLLDPEGLPSKNVASLAVGGSHRCALTTTRKVWCWGSDAAGQLGNGEPNFSTSSAVAVNVPGTVTKVVAGERGSCALSAGLVYCWGAPAEPAGTGSTNAYLSTPTRVPGIAGATDVSLSDRSGCAIVDQAVECWPFPSPGAGPRSRVYTVRDSSGKTLKPVAAISLGTDTGCALHKDAGSVWCWGAALPGREPVKSAGFIDDDVELANAVISGPATVYSDIDVPATDLAVGDDHLCVLTELTGVQCLGSDDDGQLGTADDSTTSTTVTAIGPRKARALAAGARHTCAALADDTVECWGSAADGETGAQETQSVRSAKGRPDATETPLLLTLDIPPSGWVVEPGRVGQLVVGMNAAEAVTTGLVKPADPDTGCDVQWDEEPGLLESGVRVEFREGTANALDSITVLAQHDGAPRQPLTTSDGLGVDTPVEELQARYGAFLEPLGPSDSSGEHEAYVVFGQAGALIFRVADFGDGVRVTAMEVRPGAKIEDVDTAFGQIC